MAGGDRWRLDLVDLEVLGLSPRGALGKDALKKAYRKTATRWHPDLNKGKEKEATEHFLRAKLAYEKLQKALDEGWDGRMGGGSRPAPATPGSPSSSRPPTPSAWTQTPSRASPYTRGNGAAAGATASNEAFRRWHEAETRWARVRKARERVVYQMRGEARGAAAISFMVPTLLLGLSGVVWHYTGVVPNYTNLYRALCLLLTAMLWTTAGSAVLALFVVLVTRLFHYELSVEFVSSELRLFGWKAWRRTVPLLLVKEVKHYHFILWSVLRIDASLSLKTGRTTGTFFLFLGGDSKKLMETVMGVGRRGY